MQLTNATNANGTTGITTATASTDITEIDQDVTFALTRDVASVSEEAGGTVTFTITLSQAVNAGNSVSIDIADVAGARRDQRAIRRRPCRRPSTRPYPRA